MTLPAQVSPRIAALLAKTKATRGRLIFALDASASREATWDLATTLQAQMFEEAARTGGLDMQLAYYHGDQFRASEWLGDACELLGRMRAIRCVAGTTRIAQMLQHIRAEHAREKISAVAFIGDAVEEPPSELYAAAAGLSVPVLWFQEGGDLVMPPGDPPQTVEQVFRELARLTHGAYGKFDAGAARQLAELLRAVAAFAAGGFAALANQRTGGAQKLLEQLK
jgi:hypothetical protein